MTRVVLIATTLAMSLLLAACESGGSGGGDPGARALPAGKSCGSVRGELNQMDAQGAQAKVERASRGNVDAATKAVADRYNELLNEYLGARCHV